MQNDNYRVKMTEANKKLLLDEQRAFADKITAPDSRSLIFQCIDGGGHYTFIAIDCELGGDGEPRRTFQYVDSSCSTTRATTEFKQLK